MPLPLRRGLPGCVSSAFLFLIASFISAAVSEAGPVTGRLVDESGQPVAGARVLVSSDGVPRPPAETDNAGRFTFDTPAGRRTTVRASVDGYRAEPVSFEHRPDPIDLGTITLRVSAVSDAVVVSAAQVEVPLSEVTASVTVIDAAELETTQSHSVADALRTVPGLTVVSTGGPGATTGVFPRGGESNYTLVLIDGVPANSFGGDYDFGHLSTANVDRIEVVRGPQSALFGANAIGSVVRVVTRRGGPPTGTFRIEGGTFDTWRASAAAAGSRGAAEWGGSYDQLLTAGRNGALTDAGERVSNDDYERRVLTGSAGWRTGSRWVRGTVQHAWDERGFPGPFGSNPIGAYTGIDTVSRGENTRTLAGVGAFLPVSRRLQLQVQGSHSRIDSDFASAFGASGGFSRRSSGRLQADVAAATGLDLSSGVELQLERAGSSFITGESAREIPVTRRIAGYFAEGRYNSHGRLFLTAGVRLEQIRRDTLEASPDRFSPRPVLPADTVVSANPRLAAAWLLRGGLTGYTRVRGAFGTGIRPPDGFELAFTDNPSLRPERSVSSEAGIDHAFAAGRALLEATFFTNAYDDLIVAVGPASGVSQYRTDNISNARARGLEAAASTRTRLAAGTPFYLDVRAGYTFLDTEVLAIDRMQDAPPPFTVGQDLVRRPRHQFFLQAMLASPHLTAFVQAGGRGRSLDVEPSLGTFGGLFAARGYQVWSAGGSWRLGRWIEPYARIENLADRRYEEALGFPAPGRTAVAGIHIAAGR